MLEERPPVAEPAFGRVIERVVARDEEVTFVFLDFDTGTLLPPSFNLELSKGAARANVTTLAWPTDLKEWVKENRVNAVLGVHPKEIGFKALGVRRARVSGGQLAKPRAMSTIAAKEALEVMAATSFWLKGSFSAFAFVV